MLKRKAPWHGLDSTARQNPSSFDYYTPKNCSGWNQQVPNGQVVLICCGNQGQPPLFILRGDTCTQPTPEGAAPVPRLPVIYSLSYDSLN